MNAPPVKRVHTATGKKPAAAPVTRKPNPLPSNGHTLRRKSCACGGGCPKCLTEAGIQAKLIIGAPDDQYEQEADRVADQVMRMQTSPEPHLSEKASGLTQANDSNISTAPAVQRRQAGNDKEEPEEIEEEQPQTKLMNGAIQRQPETEGGEEGLVGTVRPKTTPGLSPAVGADTYARIQSLQGGGRPLPQPTRNFFESRMGHDFSNVRIHTGATAAEAARSVNARAFTLGRDVVFDAGQYAPEAAAGRRLLAHELVHVLQQNVPGLKLIQREVWWRGEGVDVPRVSHGAVVHDLGDGLYLSDRADVALEYARLRGTGTGGQGPRLLTADIPEGTLGRVLDLTTDPRWTRMIDEMVEFTGRPARELLRSGEPYWGVFRGFLEQHNININDYDAIIGEEYIRGGRQICIRSAHVETTVQGMLRPAPILGGVPEGVPGREITPAESYRVGTRTTVLNAVADGADTLVELEVRFTEGLDDFNRSVRGRGDVLLPERMVLRVRVNAQGAFAGVEALEGPAALAEAVARQAVRAAPVAAAEGEAAVAGVAAAGAGRVPLWFRGLGWVGMIVFVGITGYQLAHATPDERPRIATQALGGLAAGAVGGYVVCNLLLGIETAGLSLLGCLFVAGGVTGYVGAEAAGEVYDWAQIPGGAVGPWEIPASSPVTDQNLSVHLETPRDNFTVRVRDFEDTNEFNLAGPGAALVVLSDLKVRTSSGQERALQDDEALRLCLKKDNFWYNPTVACTDISSVPNETVPMERRVLFLVEEAGEHFINLEFSRLGIGGVTAVGRVRVYHFAR